MPAHSQLDIEVSPHGFVAVVTPPRSRLTLVLLPVEIIALGLFCGLSIFIILKDNSSLGAWVGSVALFVLGCVGIYAMSQVWRWTAFGKEVIEVNQKTLKVKGFGKLEQYSVSELWGFSVRIEERHPLIQWRAALFNAVGDSVFFTYHFVEHSLGCRLSEADAKTLVERIQVSQRANAL